MPELRIYSGDRETRISFADTPMLVELLREHGFPLRTPCGGRGVCGGCRVEASGSLEPEPVDGACLACRTRLTGNAVVRLPEWKPMKNIALAGSLPVFELDPLPGRLGLAVDLGTTTIAVQLVDLISGHPMASVAEANPQGLVSDNVIGRIEAAMAGKADGLRKTALAAIGRLKAEACSNVGVPVSEVDSTVITGNTAMLTLLTGRDPSPLSRAPFQADHLFGEWTEDGRLYLPPCAGAFVGADFICALLASGICEREETALLVDIGTNGEVALWHENRLYCCATAAGPAFEGGGISRGLGSVPGAIDTVRVTGSGLEWTTIGDEPASGICGTGLVDAAAALLHLEILDETGALEEETVQIAPSISLTRWDIRMLQLAKGALAAGIETLCESVGINPGTAARFCIAGGFGSHLNAQSASAIGLIPEAYADSAEALGNAALTGAMMLLLAKGFEKRAENIARGAHLVSLAGNRVFADRFADCMMFAPR